MTYTWRLGFALLFPGSESTAALVTIICQYDTTAHRMSPLSAVEGRITGDLRDVICYRRSASGSVEQPSGFGSF